MPSLIYAPEVRVQVKIEDPITGVGRLIDVSEDLTAGTVTRVSDGVSTLSLNIANPQRKYDGVFTPNDPIIVSFKRISWVRCFTGYLTSVPLISVFAATVQLTASCSLKRLQKYQWDPTTTASQNMITNAIQAGQTGHSTDNGMTEGLLQVLEKVVGWPRTKVHVGAIPPNWYNIALDMAQQLDVSITQAETLRTDLFVATGGAGDVGNSLTANQGSANGPYPQTEKSKSFENSHFVPNTVQAVRAVVVNFPQITDIGGYVKRNIAGTGVVSDHATGQAADFMIPNYAASKPNPAPLGEQIALFFMNNAVAFNVKYIIWYDRIWNRERNDKTTTSSREWRAYTHPSGGTSDNLQHRNHVHVSVEAVNGPFANNRPGATPLVSTTPTSATGSLLPASSGSQSKGLTPGVYDKSSLNADQTAIASQVASILQQRGFTSFDLIVTYMTIQQESHFVNLAGGDRDSVGIYQQRPSQGWGSIAQCRDIVHATNKFLDAMNDLVPTPGRYKLAKTVVAQKVQRSGFPNAYAKWEPMATAMVDAVWGNGGGTAGSVNSAAAGTTDTAGAAATSGDSIQAHLISLQNSPLLGDGDSIDSLFGDNKWYAINQSATNGSATVLSEQLTGVRALMNDQPILPWVKNVMNSTMRSFCSAPNGDLVGWFPDYYGLWGTASIMNIETIELREFVVNWDDTYLVTHQYAQAAGDTSSFFIDTATGSISSANPQAYADVLKTYTHGIASIDFPAMLWMLLGIKPTDEAAQNFADWVKRRFGVQPDIQQVNGVVGPKAEFFSAIMLWMRQWAYQYVASIPVTFMPEVYPGMLVRIPERDFQAYVTTVTHSFQMGNGGFFTTDITTVAPAYIPRAGSNNHTLVGMPVAGGLSLAGSTSSTNSPGVID